MNKICKTCKIEKDLTEFSLHKTGKYGVKAHCKLCFKEKMGEYMKIYWKENNRSKYRKKEYEKIKDKREKYGRNDYNPETSKKRKQDNKLKSRLYKAKRRAIEKSTEDGSVNPRAIMNMMVNQLNMCNICGIDILNNFHIDHIIPISKEGPHTINNIQLLCPKCNMQKSNKL